MDGCKKCTLDSECEGGEIPGCTYSNTPDTPLCNWCILEKINESIRTCRTSGWEDDHGYIPPPKAEEKNTENTSPKAVDQEKPSPTEIPAGATDDDLSSSESQGPVTKRDYGNEANASIVDSESPAYSMEYEESPEPEAKCVSTKWLEDNGMSPGILRKGPVSKVICIPGLPCATPGHLLRRCEQQSCSLVTYKEVCDNRSDCTESAMEVSQLSHQFDWSNVRSGELALTSLSAHPNSTALSISRLIAHIADQLNKKNLGFVTDLAARFYPSFSSTVLSYCSVEWMNSM